MLITAVFVYFLLSYDGPGTIDRIESLTAIHPRVK